MSPISATLGRQAKGLAWCLATLLVPHALSANSHTLEIASWQGDRIGAVSLTFDDGTADHWSTAVPALDARNIDATFFVITNSVDWDGARTAASSGHEIASHSTTNAKVIGAGNSLPADARDRLTNSRTAIETEIGQVVPGYTVSSFAYPFGITSPEADGSGLPSVVAETYLAARTAGGSADHNSSDPGDWAYRFNGSWQFGNQGGESPEMAYYWISRSVAADPSTSASSITNHLTNHALNNGKWAVYLYHNVGDGTAFGAQMDAVAAFADSLWIAPFGDVSRYVRQRENATLVMESSTASELQYSLQSTLDDARYNVPLTLIFTAPENWSEPVVEQNGEMLAMSGDEGIILVNVAPDGGIVRFFDNSGEEPVAPVVAVNRSPSEFQMRFASEVGTSYTLQASTDLSSWEDVDPAVTLSGDDETLSHAIPFEGQTGFYRWTLD